LTRGGRFDPNQPAIAVSRLARTTLRAQSVADRTIAGRAMPQQRSGARARGYGYQQLCSQVGDHLAANQGTMVSQQARRRQHGWPTACFRQARVMGQPSKGKRWREGGQAKGRRNLRSPGPRSSIRSRAESHTASPCSRGTGQDNSVIRGNSENTGANSTPRLITKAMPEAKT